MAKYILLRIEDDSEADDLLRACAMYSEVPLLVPHSQSVVHVELVPGLDPSDDLPALERAVESYDLESVVRRSYLRVGEVAAEWEVTA